MRHPIALLLALALAAGGGAAQDHTTDASVHRSRMLLARDRLPSPEEVRVYDFVNYHRHELTPATVDGPVALDVRLLRSDLAEGPTRAFLQLGIATWRPTPDDVAPIHLTVVVDVSGSMASEDKIGHVRRGLATLLRFLDEDDLLSIVTFSNEGRVVRSAAPVGAHQPILTLIEGLTIGGGTNLHDGLVKGLEEIEAHADGERFAKIILLSDGQANQGVTDLEAIVGEAGRRLGDSIALSTIGLGLDFDDRLMNQLARAAGGTYHFLDSPDAIERTFVQEVTSLLGFAGRDPRLVVELAEGVHLYHVHGYGFAEGPRTVTFDDLPDLPLSLTQVVPIELDVDATFDPSAGPLARATLEYVDPAGRRLRLAAEVQATRRAPGAAEGPSDPSVRKNRTIARLAEGFHAACRVVNDPSIPEAQRRDRAGDAVDEALAAAEADLGPIESVTDADLRRLLDLLVEARSVLGRRPQ